MESEDLGPLNNYQAYPVKLIVSPFTVWWVLPHHTPGWEKEVYTHGTSESQSSMLTLVLPVPQVPQGECGSAQLKDAHTVGLHHSSGQLACITARGSGDQKNPDFTSIWTFPTFVWIFLLSWLGRNLPSSLEVRESLYSKAAGYTHPWKEIVWNRNWIHHAETEIVSPQTDG